MKKKIIIYIIIVALITTMVYFLTNKRTKDNINASNSGNKNVFNISENNIEIAQLDMKTNNGILKQIPSDIMGRLEIEKIKLLGDVKDGSNKDVLKDYIGHIEETAIYDGNIGLAAHNRGNKYSYFAKINELEKGDKIKYTTKFGRKTYVVIQKKTIEETDWSMLQKTKDNRITLITCIANKPSKRLCVQAVEDSNKN